MRDRFDEAIAISKKNVEIEPAFPPTYAYLALSSLAKGDLESAVRWIETPAFAANNPPSAGLRGGIYGAVGRSDDAKRMLEELREAAERIYVSPFHFAMIHFRLGNMEEYRKQLWTAYEDRANSVVMFNVGPVFDPFRSDPDFQEIISKVGLP